MLRAVLAVALALPMTTPCMSGPAAETDLCAATSPMDDRLETVGERGELGLASGSKAVLSGIRWPQDDTLARKAREWLADKAGAVLSVAIRGRPDRWGRHPIDAALDGADLAGGLVAAGLVLADAGEADTLCRKNLLAAEDAPRRAGEGVWRQAVLDVQDGAAYDAREGEFVVAQGRVLSAVERPKRTYLNFTARQKRGLSVTVSKRTWRIMLGRGLTAETLRGRFVRVRGTVEIWQGPILDIVSADMIEVLDGGAAQPR